MKAVAGYFLSLVTGALLLMPGACAVPQTAGIPAEVEAEFLSREDMRRYDEDFFALKLGDQEARIRARACLALGRIGFLEVPDPFAADLERLLVKDADAGVRAVAAFALGEAEERASAPALLEALKDPDAQVRAAAAEALSKIGGEVEAEALAQMVTEELSADVRRTILLSAWRLNGERLAAGALNIVRSGDEKLLWPAAYHLTRNQRSGTLEVEPKVIESLAASPDRDVRTCAARLLPLVRDPARAGAMLDTLLKDADQGVRINALRIAAQMAYPGIPAAVKECAGAAEPHLRLEAAAAAGRYVDLLQQAGKSPVSDEGIAAVIDVVMALTGDAEEAVAAAAVRALAVPGARSPLATKVETLVADNRPLVRAAAIDLVVSLGGPKVPQQLQAMLADPVSIVRIGATEAYGSLPLQDAVPAMIAALESEDEVVVAVAASFFSTHPQPEAKEAVLQAWQRFQASKNIEAQSSILAAVAAYVEDEAAKSVVREALGSPARGVRLAAARLLLGTDGPAVFELVGEETLPRDVSFYTGALATLAQYPRVRFTTNKGEFVLALDSQAAPLTAFNLQTLVKQGYYDGITIHRVVPDFVAQMGCPRGDGWGGPGYDIRCEVNTLRYDRGAVGMALAGKDTGGSQFFIALAPVPHLDGGYTIFAHVESRLEVAERLLPGDGIIKAELLEARK